MDALPVGETKCADVDVDPDAACTPAATHAAATSKSAYFILFPFLLVVPWGDFEATFYASRQQVSMDAN